MWNQKLLYKEENNHQREEAAYRRGNIPCQERGLESKIYKGLQNQTWRKQKQQQKWNQTIESLNVLAKWIRNSLKNYQWPTTSEKVFNIHSHQRKAKRFHFSPLRRAGVKTTRGEQMLVRRGERGILSAPGRSNAGGNYRHWYGGSSKNWKYNYRVTQPRYTGLCT